MVTPQVSENPATQRQYIAQLTISAALAQALRTLWASVTPLSSESAWDSFCAAVRAVVPQYAQAASVVSLDNYRATRTTAGITTVPTLPRITPPALSKIDAGLDWAARARRDADLAAALTDIETKVAARVEAAMQKVLLDEAHETTVAAVEGDELALGFRRVPRPDACAWCIIQAIRRTSRRGLAAEFTRYGTPGTMGDDEHWGVFKSRASAGQIPPDELGNINRFHNGCHCVVEAIFDTAFAPPAWLRDLSELYDDTDGGLNGGFRRALTARRGGVPAPDPRPTLPTPSAQPAPIAAIADLLGGIDAAMRAA